MREDLYREGYSRSLEGKRVEVDGDDNVKLMWEQVKRAMVESIWLSESEGKNPKDLLLLFLLKSNHSKQHSKVLYCCGGQEK